MDFIFLITIIWLWLDWINDTSNIRFYKLILAFSTLPTCIYKIVEVLKCGKFAIPYLINHTIDVLFPGLLNYLYSKISDENNILLGTVLFCDKGLMNISNDFEFLIMTKHEHNYTINKKNAESKLYAIILKHKRKHDNYADINESDIEIGGLTLRCDLDLFNNRFNFCESKIEYNSSHYIEKYSGNWFFIPLIHKTKKYELKKFKKNYTLKYMVYNVKNVKLGTYSIGNELILEVFPDEDKFIVHKSENKDKWENNLMSQDKYYFIYENYYDYKIKYFNRKVLIG